MKEKLKKIFTLKNISLFINAVLLISLLVFFVNLFKINILPTKYTIEFLIIFILLLAIFILIDFKFYNKKTLLIILDILSILFISIFIFGTSKIIETDSFLNRNSNASKEIANYYVIVKENSSYKEIEDIKNKDIYLLRDETNYNEIITKLSEAVSTTINNETDLLEMGNKLLNDEIEIVLLSDANYDLLDENIEDFETNTKIIYTISIESVLEDITKDAKVTKEPFNIYISGIDTYGKISTKSRSDVNIVMTVNPVSKKILLTSIPRDYYVQLHGTTGYKDKLTHAGVYGINMSVQTIEDILDIDINYYLRVNFNTLIDVVDVIDGIEIYSDKSFTSWTNKSCSFTKGYQTLKGTCALAFARERKTYTTGDRHRGENQQQVITAIINKVTTSKKIITNYSDILNSLDGSFQTSLSSDEIYSLIKMQLNDMSSWTIESISLNGYDSSNYTYSYKSQKLYVMEPDQKTIDSAKEKINELMNE
jgi:LCP family protein required for cell wall assembly